MIKKYKIKNLIKIFFLSIVLTSCTANLESVEKFGEDSAKVKASAERMADDIYKSCIRKTYLPTTPFPNSINIETIKQAQSKCDDLKSIDPKGEVVIVKEVNFVLINYMIALGKLASNDSVSFEKNLAKLENSIKGLNDALPESPLSGDQVNAGLQIARFIFNQLVQNFRQENVKDAIVCTNRYLQEYIPGLQEIVQDYYIDGVIKSEEQDLRQYYAKYSNVSDRGQNFAIEQSFLEKTEELISERIDSGKTYIQILSMTQKAHQDLFDEFNQPPMTQSEIDKNCESYFTTEEKTTQNLPTTKLTPTQIQRIHKITMEYQREVEPLIEKLDRSFK